jgi:hypothetical protein
MTKSLSLLKIVYSLFNNDQALLIENIAELAKASFVNPKIPGPSLEHNLLIYIYIYIYIYILTNIVGSQ